MVKRKKIRFVATLVGFPFSSYLFVRENGEGEVSYHDHNPTEASRSRLLDVLNQYLMLGQAWAAVKDGNWTVYPREN